MYYSPGGPPCFTWLNYMDIYMKNPCEEEDVFVEFIKVGIKFKFIAFDLLAPLNVSCAQCSQEHI